MKNLYGASLDSAWLLSGAYAAQLGGASLSDDIVQQTGGYKQWFRVGESYDTTKGVPTKLSVRWGASPRHVNKIKNTTLRRINKWLRKLGEGHWHIKY